jgi:hypothetical protein
VTRRPKLSDRRPSRRRKKKRRRERPGEIISNAGWGSDEEEFRDKVVDGMEGGGLGVEVV